MTFGKNGYPGCIKQIQWTLNKSTKVKKGKSRAKIIISGEDVEKKKTYILSGAFNL